MKRFVAVSVLVLGAAFPAGAQRPVSHSGSSSHAAPSFHGGYSAPAAHGFPTAPRYSGNRPAYMPHTYRPRTISSFAPRSGNNGHAPGGGHGPDRGHGPDHDRGRHRGIYISPYGYGIGPALGWYGPGYSSDFGYDDSQDPGQNYPADGSDANGGSNEDAGPVQGSDPYYAPGPQQGYGQPDGYGPMAPTPGPPPPRMPYRPSAPESQAPAAIQGEGAVTLVFKDGRPSEQIRNYMLTPTTLYIGGEHHREIPLDQIDMAATEDANRDTGTDFHLPAASN